MTALRRFRQDKGPHEPWTTEKEGQSLCLADIYLEDGAKLSNKKQG